MPSMESDIGVRPLDAAHIPLNIGGGAQRGVWSPKLGA